jgi:predicted nucleic acid-binding Zn ribbon protein
MTRDRNYQDLPSILNTILKKYDLEGAVNSEHLFAQWEIMVGEKIAKQCKPVEFKDGILVVQAKNDIWRQELAQRLDDLLNLLNGRIKSSLVKKIKII